MADGIATAKAVAGLEAIRALPPAAQLKAVEGLGSAASSYDNAYSRAEAAYNRWAQRNPNAAEAVGVAGTVGRYAVERGVKSKSGDSGKKDVTGTGNTSLEKAQQRADRLSSSDRSGKDFTRAGKEAVIDLNRIRNNGDVKCANCGTETVPAKKSVADVTPPKNERQVDHVVPKSRGGQGAPSNGQVLCRDCNRRKSNK